MKITDVARQVRLFLALLIVLGAIAGWLSLLSGRATSAPQEKSAKTEVPRQVAKPWDGSTDIFEEPNREQTLRLERTMRDLKIRRGSRVADIGAGGGWLSTRLARRVGPNGRVYANEILPKYVDELKTRAARERLPQMIAVLGTPDDPKLPANSVDAVVILNAYHEFARPLTMLTRLRASMKPGARLGFIERDTDELRREAEAAYRTSGKVVRRVDEVPDDKAYTDDHRLALPIVRREAESAGFKFVLSRELGDDKYLVVVSKPGK